MTTPTPRDMNCGLIGAFCHTCRQWTYLEGSDLASPATTVQAYNMGLSSLSVGKSFYGIRCIKCSQDLMVFTMSENPSEWVKSVSKPSTTRDDLAASGIVLSKPQVVKVPCNCDWALIQKSGCQKPQEHC